MIGRILIAALLVTGIAEATPCDLAKLAEGSLAQHQQLREELHAADGLLRSRAYFLVIRDLVATGSNPSTEQVIDHLYKIFDAEPLGDAPSSPLVAEERLRLMRERALLTGLTPEAYLVRVRELEAIRRDPAKAAILREMVAHGLEAALNQGSGMWTIAETTRNIVKHVRHPAALAVGLGGVGSLALGFGINEFAPMLVGAFGIVFASIYPVGESFFTMLGWTQRIAGGFGTRKAVRDYRKIQEGVRENARLLSAEARRLSGPRTIAAEEADDPRDVEAATLGLDLGTRTADHASRVQQAMALVHAPERWVGLAEAMRGIGPDTKRADVVSQLATPFAKKAASLQESRQALDRLRRAAAKLDEDFAARIAQAEVLKATYLAEHEAAVGAEREAAALRVERVAERAGALRANRTSLKSLGGALDAADRHIGETAEMIESTSNALIAGDTDPAALETRLKAIRALVAQNGEK